MANLCTFCGTSHNPVPECTGGFEYPHYPICEMCEEETDDASGWCSPCCQYADGRQDEARRIATLEQELSDICADIQEGGSWARHRDRFRQLNAILAEHQRKSA